MRAAIPSQLRRDPCTRAGHPELCSTIENSWSQKMKVLLSGLAVCVLAFSQPLSAAEFATAKEAEAMVRKAVAAIKANGKDKVYAEVTRKGGQFSDRDLYLTIYRLDGTALAHGANEKFIGKNMLDFRDVDGKEFFRERMELAKAKGTFWQDYKFVNPVSKKVEPKSMYCERLDDTVVCGGIYK
jgi:signal transduction histidine kinase